MQADDSPNPDDESATESKCDIPPRRLCVVSHGPEDAAQHSQSNICGLVVWQIRAFRIRVVRRVLGGKGPAELPRKKGN